jgi:RimJ/RimL family protein N-acetyltransferase
MEPLTTERLVLRPPTLDDLTTWHATFLDAEEVWYGAPRSSLDENRAKLAGQIAHHEEHGFGSCSVELRGTGEAIGAAGLKQLDGGPEIEVHYRFLKEH